MSGQIELRKGAASPVHPLGLMVVLGLDWMWSIVETGTALTGAGLVALLPMCVGIGAIAAVCVGAVQYFVAKESFGTALAKALCLGVVAALPFQIASTAIGAPLLMWSGVKYLRRKSSV